MLDVLERFERLGESREYGWVLLELLEQQGWLVHVRSPFAGSIDADGTPGVLVLAAHPDLPDVEIALTGRSVAEIASPLVVAASGWIPELAAARRRRAAA